jgi:hypothetical protein
MAGHETNSGAIVRGNFTLDVRGRTTTTASSMGIGESWQVLDFMYRGASLTFHACCGQFRSSLNLGELVHWT